MHGATIRTVDTLTHSLTHTHTHTHTCWNVITNVTVLPPPGIIVYKVA